MKQLLCVWLLVACGDRLVTEDICPCGPCENLQADPNHCGACDNECASGRCKDGQCDGECLERDRRACGDRSLESCDHADQVCEGGAWTPCPIERCDDRDNDCDGQVDEGLATNACGECGQPDQAELCNSMDDDCDGRIDESIEEEDCYGGPLETRDIGECRSGRRVCDGGSVTLCQEDVRPKNETCDGKDNDCDGRTDEEIPEDPCELEENVPRRCEQGVFKCLGSSLVCVPFRPSDPEEETGCDLIDNDCDFLVDENVLGECGLIPITLCNGRRAVWRPLTHIPKAARYDAPHAVAYHEGEIHILNGSLGDPHHAWSPARSSWRRFDDAPMSTKVGLAVSHGGALYGFGDAGDGRQPGVFRWTERNRQWSFVTVFERARRNAWTIVADDQLFVLGGTWVSDVPGPATAVDRFDLVNHEWHALADLPWTSSFVAPVMHQGVLYAFGPEGEVAVYDSELNSWTSRAPIEWARRWPTAHSVGDQILLVGGAVGSRGQNDVAVYDPVSGTLVCSDTGMPLGFYLHVPIQVGNILYLVGGLSDEVEGRPTELIWSVEFE